MRAYYSYLSDVVPVEEGEGLGLHNGGDLVQGLASGSSSPTSSVLLIKI